MKGQFHQRFLYYFTTSTKSGVIIARHCRKTVLSITLFASKFGFLSPEKYSIQPNSFR